MTLSYASPPLHHQHPCTMPTHFGPMARLYDWQPWPTTSSYVVHIPHSDSKCQGIHFRYPPPILGLIPPHLFVLYILLHTTSTLKVENEHYYLFYLHPVWLITGEITLPTILHIQPWYLYHAIRNIFIYKQKMTLKSGQNL